MNTLVDFLPMNIDFPRRGRPEFHLLAVDAKYGDGDVIADADNFANAAR